MDALQSVYMKSLDPWTVQVELSDTDQTMKVKAKVNQECLEDALDDLVECDAINEWVRDTVFGLVTSAWELNKVKCTKAELELFTRILNEAVQ